MENEKSQTSTIDRLDLLLSTDIAEITGERDMALLGDYFAQKAGVPPRISDCTFSGLHPAVESELKALPYQQGGPRAVLLCGPTGTGKSCLLSALAKEYFYRMCREIPNLTGIDLVRGALGAVEYVHYREFSAQIRASLNAWEGLPTLDELMYGWIRRRVLIIDDLFDGNGTDWDLQKIGEIIDVRYSNNWGWTWLASNMSARDMKSLAGFERSYSRLSDKNWCRYFEIKGHDMRKKV